MKKLLIAQYFPEINKAINSGYRYKDINENLKSNGVIVSTAMLHNSVKQIRDKSLIKDCKKIICFYPFTDENKDYLDFAYGNNGLWYAQSNAIADINKNWIISASNIQKLKSPLARIYAKWILQEFDFSNSTLLSDIPVTEDQQKIISEIHITFPNYLSEVISITHKKYLEYIFSNLRKL